MTKKVRSQVWMMMDAETQQNSRRQFGVKDDLWIWPAWPQHLIILWLAVTSRRMWGLRLYKSLYCLDTGGISPAQDLNKGHSGGKGGNCPTLGIGTHGYLKTCEVWKKLWNKSFTCCNGNLSEKKANIVLLLTRISFSWAMRVKKNDSTSEWHREVVFKMTS